VSRAARQQDPDEQNVPQAHAFISMRRGRGIGLWLQRCPVTISENAWRGHDALAVRSNDLEFRASPVNADHDNDDIRTDADTLADAQSQNLHVLFRGIHCFISAADSS
jgi:hypothetical protein